VVPLQFLLLAFVVIPVVEMWLLIEVGSRIGALPTIALVLLTAVIGLALLRRQGFATLVRGHRRLEEGELPATEIVEGLVLAVAGALLLTPGFVTDAIGFAGLIPQSRQWLVRRLLARIGEVGFASYEVHQRQRGDDGALDGEYWREPDFEKRDVDRSADDRDDPERRLQDRRQPDDD